MTLKVQLKNLISEREITVAKLAKATGISRKTIYHYLAGRSPRNLLHIKLICNYFKISADYLLFGQESKGFEKYQDEIAAGVYEVILRPVKKE